MEDKLDATISVVVPSLNEKEALLECVQQLVDRNDIDEIIIVDSSRSRTMCDFYQNQFFALKDLKERLIVIGCTQQARSLQMNIGAELASGTFVLFLHADTRLPKIDLKIFFTNKFVKLNWGFFRVQLDGSEVWKFVLQTCMSYRARLTGIATGDMCIFVRNDTWKQYGPFGDIPLMEDIDLCSRLRKFSKPYIVSSPVITSARRWRQRGVGRTILEMWKLRLMFWRGVPIQRIRQIYQNEN